MIRGEKLGKVLGCFCEEEMRIAAHPNQEDVLIVEAFAVITDAAASQFVLDMFNRIDEGCRRVVVDCARTDFFSSIEVGVLAAIHSRMKMRNGEIKICAANNIVLEVLAVTHMNRIFDIHPDIENSLRAFRGT